MAVCMTCPLTDMHMIGGILVWFLGSDMHLKGGILAWFLVSDMHLKGGVLAWFLVSDMHLKGGISALFQTGHAHDTWGSELPDRYTCIYSYVYPTRDVQI